MNIQNRKNDYDYYKCFCELSECAKKASHELCGFMQSCDLNILPSYCQSIHDIEKYADLKHHELCRRLMREFIAPIEHDDILVLSQCLDDVVDSIENIIFSFDIYRINSITSYTVQAAQLIDDACGKLCMLINTFKNFKKSVDTQQYIIDINTLQNSGADICRLAVKQIFQSDTLYKEQIGLAFVFKSFSNCFAVIEKAANLIELIIIKNS